MARRVRHYVSKLFQPQNIVPKNAEVKYDDITSRSQKLMCDLGYIRHANNGLFYILPLGERCLRKLENIVNEEMEHIGAQKIVLPSLVAANLWKTSGRLHDVAADELFTLKDRHDKLFVLSPTHEETITELFSSMNNLSYRHLPLRLYQITSKFRDEMKPRFGLLRSKEFIMKDLYSFDVDMNLAKETYETVTAAYKTIFNRIGVKYVRVAGLTGVMGGSISHEFHFTSEVGEDHLILCRSCGNGSNAEVFSHLVKNTEKQDKGKCLICGHTSLSQVQGIEVGHTFLLGTRYSKPLRAQFVQKDGKPAFLEMGCYGLGLTRILGAAVECLSQPSEIRWPLPLAPFRVCIIPPKSGSKESQSGSSLYDILCHQLDSVPSLSEDIITDDRIDLTIGRRLHDASRVGYPVAVVLGKQTMDTSPVLEVHHFASGQQVLLPVAEAVQYIVQQATFDDKLVALENDRLMKVNVGHV